MEDNRIFKFLTGLNVEFDEVRRRIIGRQPSPCKINLGLKLLILYPVESEKGCAKLEKSRMERSYYGLKGDVVQNSQWMDIGQRKVKVWEVSKVLL